MAERIGTITELKTFMDDCHIIRWTGLLNTDTGDRVEMPGSADRTVQVDGTFGAGGTLRWEGTNDGTTYYPLNDPQGNVLDFTVAKIEQVLEITRYMRPRVTAGDGTTNLAVTILLRRPFK
jgi:hypothetical protein